MTVSRRWTAFGIAMMLVAATIGIVSPAAAVPAIPPDVCRVTITITTGNDGIRDNSIEHLRLAGQQFRFEDTGEFGHHGGTGDRSNATFNWNADLPACVSRAQLAQGFELEHEGDPPFEFPDDWDLRAIRITDRDTGFIYYDLDGTSAGRVHRFDHDKNQTWNTNSSRSEPAVDNNTNPVCRLTFRVTTGNDDGLRNDSIERIRLDGQTVLFEDSDGDGTPDPPPLVPSHRGGTDDLGSATFEWRTQLSPCVPHSRLVHGFEFEHESPADDLSADNWNLSGLKVTDGDTGFVYHNLDDSGGRILHRFRKNEDQKWNTNQSRVTSDADSDGDGLTDDWERHGFNATNDLTLDVDLPALGANPDHKDIFLELDWVNGRQPTRSGIQAMKRAFAAAPITAGSAAASMPPARNGIRGVDAPENPDHQPGITLHVDTGRLVDPTVQEGAPTGSCSDGIDDGGDGVLDGADQDCLGQNRYLDSSVEDPGAPNCTDGMDNNENGDGPADGNDPSCLVGDDLGGLGNGNQLAAAPNTCGVDTAAFVASKRANFDPNRRLIFHYGVLAPRPPGCSSTTGGQGEGGGNDFISFNRDAGTLMHELGHNLNLRHGGFETTNCKPNYPSVMNYDVQSGIRRVGGGVILDYSPPRINLGGLPRGQAPLLGPDLNNDGTPDPLVENQLVEPTVLDPSDNANRFVFRSARGAKVTNNLNLSPDWDNDGSTTTAPVAAVNINGADNRGRPAGCARNTSSTDTLRGWDDWRTISLPFRQFADAVDGTAGPVEPEDSPTDEELAEMDTQLNTTDVGVGIADVLDPVAAGGELTYRLQVTNHGPNPASSVRLVDTLPAQVSLVSADSPCTAAGLTVSCGLGELVAGSVRTVTVTVHIPADLAHRSGGPVTLVNHAEVHNLVGPDPNPGNNSADETSTVTGAADLAVTGFAPVNPPAHTLVGQSLSVTLRTTLTNLGPSSPIDATVVATTTVDPGSSVAPTSSTRTVNALAVGHAQTSDTTWTIACPSPGSHTYRFTDTVSPARTGDLDPNPADNQRSTEITVDCLVPVAANIKPGGNPNSINIPADTVPVAVLTTTAGEYGLPLGFDATTILPTTIHFGPERVLFPDPAGSVAVRGRGHIEDAPERSTGAVENTKDGDLDMVLQFPSTTSGLTPADTAACVIGSFTDRPTGRTHRFFGCDAVRVVKP